MMRSTVVLQLDEGLSEFVDVNCGEGTLYISAGEFIRDLLRREKAQQDAAAICEGIREAIATQSKVASLLSTEACDDS